jgi:hypothetical protein
MAKADAEPRSGAGIARAASLVALGNVSSRALGLARETISASLFGASGLVSAFGVASIISSEEQLTEQYTGDHFTIADLGCFPTLPRSAESCDKQAIGIIDLDIQNQGNIVPGCFGDKIGQAFHQTSPWRVCYP